MADPRNVYPDDLKRKAVQYANQAGSIPLAAEQYDVWESMIRRWARDPRYGGKPGAFTRAKRAEKMRRVTRSRQTVSASHRDDISTVQRKRAVASAFAGKRAPADIGKALGVSASAIYIWCTQPRYGGKEGGLSGHNQRGREMKPNGKANSVGLPINEAAKASDRVKLAVPLVFGCPHCGGKIRMGGEA